MRRSPLLMAAVVGVIATTYAVVGRTSASAFSPGVTLVVSGLNNPRGLTFGPDGALYVAEGGLGGSAQTTMADCEQVPGPVGPYGGGFTSRISRVANGVRTTVADNLPSSQTSPMLNSLVSGVADVAFIGNQLYAIEAGAGCSHGLKGTNNEVLRVNSNGSTTPIVNLSAFQKAHPVQHPEADDFEPDGTWYSMVAVRGSLYAVEPNHGEIDRIDPVARTIDRVIDVSASEGHIVPTAITYKGNFFFGNLNTFPITPGSSSIFKVTPSGNIGNWFDHFTTVLGVDFGSHDRMYVLESMTVAGFPGPGELFTGRVLQIDPNGRRSVIATGFSFPTAMRMGPDGALYVTDFGFAGPVQGLGSIYRVTVP